MKVITTAIKNLHKFFSGKRMEESSVRSFFTNDTSKTSGSASHCEYVETLQTFIPKLTSNLRKGQCGRIGIIGGSFEYTGAPYFTAISSLKLGSDLVYVFCCKSAGVNIKSYSPELMVYPFLDEPGVVRKIEPVLEKLHVLVIGPGLGRDKDVLKNVEEIIKHCKTNMKEPLPLIIDADGLYLITQNLTLIADYKAPVILTPNGGEFERLALKLNEKDPVKIANYLNCILLQKGNIDVIANGMQNQIFPDDSQEYILCDIPGSNRRCGGQGDILCGCVGTFMAWLQIYLKKTNNFEFNSLARRDSDFIKEILRLYSAVAYGGCIITRTSSRLAFESHERSMTASDIIPYINKAFKLYFGQ